MKKNVVLSLLGLVLLVSAVAAFNMACAEKSSNRADIARKRVTPVLNSFLEPCGARVGSLVFLRAVKEDSVLELWVKPVRKTGPQGEGRGQANTGRFL